MISWLHLFKAWQFLLRWYFFMLMLLQIYTSMSFGLAKENVVMKTDVRNSLVIILMRFRLF